MQLITADMVEARLSYPALVDVLDNAFRNPFFKRHYPAAAQLTDPGSPTDCCRAVERPSTRQLVPPHDNAWRDKMPSPP